MNDYSLSSFAMRAVISPRLIEFLNGSTMVIHLAMTYFFFRYVTLRFCDYGFNEPTYRNVDGALAVAVLSLGCLLVRGGFWWLRFMQNRDMDTTSWVPVLSGIVALGAIITVGGGVCSVRVFTPAPMGHWPWIWTLSVSLAVGSLAFLY